VAIVECDQCGNPRSDQALSCSSCGASVAADPTSPRSVASALLFGALLAALYFIVMRFA
jgi:MYXO-CTERM domain-containing protein